MEKFITSSIQTNSVMYKKLHQDENSMGMTLNEFEYLTSTCRTEKYQPLTNDMTKNKYTGRYRLGFNCLFVPSSSTF